MTQDMAQICEDEAAAWAARMDRDDWSAADEFALQRWLDGDARRHGALLRAQAMWLALDQREAQAANDDSKREVRPARWWRYGIGGGMAAIAASFAAFFLMPTSEQAYRTGVGEIRQVPLADGSSVAINTGSSLEVDFHPNVRLVSLDRGEAWFKVAKNAARPFIVRAGDIRVQAVGTAFSVRRQAEGTEILVTEGRVLAWSERDKGRRIAIAAGAKAFVSSDASILQSERDSGEVDRALAWRAGKIDLLDEKVSDAVAEFNRYNQRKIVLLDDRVASERVDGVFSANDPESFAVAIQHVLDVPVDVRDPQAIRIGREKSSGS